jgi:Ni/Co efflux regulator RcnB
MVENAQGNYIDNAIALVDGVLAGRSKTDLLHKVRRQLIRMTEDHTYIPDFGHFLVDQELGEPFVTPLLEVVEWRRRALARPDR